MGTLDHDDLSRAGCLCVSLGNALDSSELCVLDFTLVSRRRLPSPARLRSKGRGGETEPSASEGTGLLVCHVLQSGRASSRGDAPGCQLTRGLDSDCGVGRLSPRLHSFPAATSSLTSLRKGSALLLAGSDSACTRGHGRMAQPLSEEPLNCQHMGVPFISSG